MAVTQGEEFAQVETQVYQYLTGTAGFNTAVACGILANIAVESGGFNYKVEVVDTNQKLSFGLCQWNAGRRDQLFKHTGTSATNPPSVKQQMDYLMAELNGVYPGDPQSKEAGDELKKITEDTAQDAYNAAKIFCDKFERPDDSKGTSEARGVSARDTYYPHYSSGAGGTATTGTTFVPNLGQRIVQIAMSAKGLDYIPEGYMYNTEYKGADSPGLVYYSYREAGKEIPNTTAQGIYDVYNSKAKKVEVSGISAGDLLFYKVNGNLSLVAIANGNNGRIYAKYGEGIVEEEDLGNPTYILRILEDSETSQGEVPHDSTSAIEYASLTSIDIYAEMMKANLARVSGDEDGDGYGYDYGYLIDMTNGGEFKFYVPEFSEQAGANWDPIDIRGRSVAIMAYNSTGSRNISISLELYAGEGLYKATTGESGLDTVSRLHRDANFVKSLEYPDYSSAIVRPPSTVHLILGSAINIVGVVSNVVVNHRKPLDPQNRAMYITLDFTVTQTAVNPPDYSDIRKGQYAAIATNETYYPFYSERTNTPVYPKEG